MYPGYFTVGGNEVGNNARALAYTRGADCPITWIREEECDGLGLAVGDGGYAYSEIQFAPWYDVDNPELSSRFLGLYVVSMEGLSDSTRAANVTEKIVDGAQVSGYRHTSRQVRVRALLSAKGQDALEAGMTWLRNVLEPDACGVHGADCGASDFQFFVDCPPTPSQFMIEESSGWGTPLTNQFANPSFEVNIASVGAGGAALAATTDWAAAGTKSLSITPNSGSTDSYASLGDVGGLQNGMEAGKTYTVGATIRLTGAQTGTLHERARSIVLHHAVVAGSYTTVLSTPAPNAAGVYRLTMTFTLPAGTTEAWLRFYNGASSGGGVVWWDAVTLVEGSDAGFFDGDTTDTTTERYAWTGTAGLSTSTRELGTTLPVQDPIAYAEAIHDYTRVLHTVSCISGPLVQRQLKSADDTHVGYIVEFTMLAAVPFVFGLPREIEVPPTTPTVIEDAAFNLEPYPSAELTNSTLTVATNYSPNPSVEVNTTDWSATTTVVSGTDPSSFFTSARVVGELQAAGTASYRLRLLGNNGTTSVTNARSYLWAQQSVPFSTGTGTRVSFSVWAAMVEFAGASGGVLNGIQVDVQWRATTTVLSTVTIGSSTNTADFGGKAYSIASQLKPPTANNALVRVRFDVTWSSSSTPANNSEIRAYVDALAVTVP